MSVDKNLLSLVDNINSPVHVSILTPFKAVLVSLGIICNGRQYCFRRACLSEVHAELTIGVPRSSR